jgi:hypothetical protein
MSQNDPEALRAEIARTRAELSDNVDTLADTANPKNIAHRQVDKVKSAAQGVREHLMGAPDDPYDSGTVGDRAGAIKDGVGQVQDRAAGALDRVGDSPELVKRKARGNPLAAGLIAFGIGYLVSSAIPASQKEQDAAGKLQEKAAPVREKVSEAASELGDRLREPAQEAVASVKGAASDAAANVKEEGVAAKDDVQGQVNASKANVQGSGSGS